jgi:hypothetical protein
MPIESRNGVRLKTLFETLYCSGREEGEAMLADVSYSGALLESEAKPSMGSSVTLNVCLPDGVKPVKLRGKVVRHTSGGFAIQYDKPNPQVVRIFDDTAVIERLVPDGTGEPSPIMGALEPDGPPHPDGETTTLDEMVIAVLLDDARDDDVPMAKVVSEGETEPSAKISPVAGVPVGAPMLLSELDLIPYSISEIEALAQRIPEVIAIKRAESKQRVLQKIKKLAELEGFSLDELFSK